MPGPVEVSGEKVVLSGESMNVVVQVGLGFADGKGPVASNSLGLPEEVRVVEPAISGSKGRLVVQ